MKYRAAFFVILTLNSIRPNTQTRDSFGLNQRPGTNKWLNRWSRSCRKSLILNNGSYSGWYPDTCLFMPHKCKSLMILRNFLPLINIFDDIMANNWILTKPLWVSIIVFYNRRYEDNTEEIYEIIFLNIFPLLCVEWSMIVCIFDYHIQCRLCKYWPPGFDWWVHCAFWILQSNVGCCNSVTTLLSDTLLKKW